MNLASLVDHRILLEGPSNVVYTGWVVNSQKIGLTLRLNTDQTPAIGDRFLAGVTYQQATATFRCQVTKQDEDLIIVQLTSGINLRDLQEDPRMRVRGMNEVLEYQGEKLMVEVRDISRSGVGLRTPVCLAKGAQLKLTLTTPSGPIHIEGEVRYSRSTDSGTYFDTGIRVIGTDRLSRSRWHRLLQRGDPLLNNSGSNMAA